MWPLLAFLLLYNRMFLWGFLNYLFGVGVALIGVALSRSFATRGWDDAVDPLGWAERTLISDTARELALAQLAEQRLAPTGRFVRRRARTRL